MKTQTKSILSFSILFLLILIQTSCTSKFNPSEELNRIEEIINNREADSISGHNEEGIFKYWIKDGKIIKLYIGEVYQYSDFEGFSDEEYFFKEDGNVFANKKNELYYPEARHYKALIIFDGANIVTEEYWLGDTGKLGSNKVSKSDIQERLGSGYSIEENILKDQKSNKIKGLLNLKDFAERLNFKIPEKEDTKSQITNTRTGNEYVEYLKSYESNPRVGGISFNEVNGKVYWVTYYHGAGTRQEYYWINNNNCLEAKYVFEYGGMNWDEEISYSFTDLTTQKHKTGEVTYSETGELEDEINELKANFIKSTQK